MCQTENHCCLCGRKIDEENIFDVFGSVKVSYVNQEPCRFCKDCIGNSEIYEIILKVERW